MSKSMEWVRTWSVGSDSDETCFFPDVRVDALAMACGLTHDVMLIQNTDFIDNDAEACVVERVVGDIAYVYFGAEIGGQDASWGFWDQRMGTGIQDLDTGAVTWLERNDSPNARELFMMHRTIPFANLVSQDSGFAGLVSLVRDHLVVPGSFKSQWHVDCRVNRRLVRGECMGLRTEVLRRPHPVANEIVHCFWRLSTLVRFYD